MIDLYREMIEKAIQYLAQKKIDIYTFAFYHDHESFAVSICVDTLIDSENAVKSSNSFKMEQFYSAIYSNEIKGLILNKLDTGRSFSLGDFTCVNLSRKDIPEEMIITDQFYFDMIKAINEKKDKIIALSTKPEEVVFCCSTEDDEVGIIWK